MCIFNIRTWMPHPLELYCLKINLPVLAALSLALHPLKITFAVRDIHRAASYVFLYGFGSEHKNISSCCCSCVLVFYMDFWYTAFNTPGLILVLSSAMTYTYTLRVLTTVFSKILGWFL
ncbi:hypothetical protein FHG87_008342 [Trinorchestia longiramus]|nr:hypothetical protein FHG87_008342 [Trinorchestia longiramus]